MKGQYFSFDAIIASVIFVLALVALLSYWQSVKSFLDYQNEGLSKEAVRVSNLLFTPPTPTRDCGTMQRLGFAMDWDDKRADADVLACSKGRDQAWLKEKLGSPYNVSIRITDLSDNTLVATIGGVVPSGASDVVKMRRLTTVVNSTDGSNYAAAFDLSIYK